MEFDNSRELMNIFESIVLKEECGVNEEKYDHYKRYEGKKCPKCGKQVDIIGRCQNRGCEYFDKDLINGRPIDSRSIPKIHGGDEDVGVYDRNKDKRLDEEKCPNGECCFDDATHICPFCGSRDPEYLEEGMHKGSDGSYYDNNGKKITGDRSVVDRELQNRREERSEKNGKGCPTIGPKTIEISKKMGLDKNPDQKKIKNAISELNLESNQTEISEKQELPAGVIKSIKQILSDNGVEDEVDVDRITGQIVDTFLTQCGYQIGNGNDVKDAVDSLSYPDTGR